MSSFDIAQPYIRIKQTEKHIIMDNNSRYSNGNSVVESGLSLFAFMGKTFWTSIGLLYAIAFAYILFPLALGIFMLAGLLYPLYLLIKSIIKN